MLETKSLRSQTNQQAELMPKGGYILVGVVIGICVALLIGLVLSWILISVPAGKASWYVVRSAGILSYILLWLATVWGLLLTTRWLRAWNMSLAIFHEFFSLLSIVFTLLHAVTLRFDTYLTFTWWHILVPFNAIPYRPLALGLGQVAFYLLVAIAISFYLRRRIGNHRWRVLHYVAPIAYGLALIHAIAAGTDTQWDALRVFYIVSALVVLFLTYVRILARPTH